MAEPINPDEEREREEQGRQLLEQIRAMRQREAAQREWLRERIAEGMREREEEERQREEEGGSGP
jgi:hypothetical protein